MIGGVAFRGDDSEYLKGVASGLASHGVDVAEFEQRKIGARPQTQDSTNYWQNARLGPGPKRNIINNDFTTW